MRSQAQREKINHKTERLFDQRLARAMEMVRAGGFEPPRAKARRIFLPPTAFAAIRRRAAGCLWSGLSLHPALASCRGLGAARLVSTPSAWPQGQPAWLGIAI